MRCALARAFILLSIALALANAQCFTRCLVEAADNATPPCHSHGKTQVLPAQHDLRPTAAPTVALCALAVSTNVIALPFLAAAELHPPPPAVSAIPLSLRF